jgi:glycosyltransferase involved in cell wall biosynthesis
MRELKILHLLSNWKWTEISEPAVDLAVAQKKLGAEVEFVCGRSPGGRAERSVAQHARLKDLEPVHVLNMPKHTNLFSTFSDCLKLRQLLKRFKPSVIHCHKSNAHLTGALSRGRPKPPLIVRSIYDPEGPERNIIDRLLYKSGTDGLLVLNEKSSNAAIAQDGFTAERVQVAEPGIDLARFSPRRKIPDDSEFSELKANFRVMGVVTRIRASRRLDIPLKALAALAPAHPQLRMLLVGRGRKGAAETVVAKPAREMKIFNRIVMPGYCSGDRLVAAYRAMDVLVYPTPGSDKSCRTVREAMAAGVPVIAPGIGFLPELIEDHITGRRMAFSWESLADILKELVQDKKKLVDMGRRALDCATRRFAPDLQARKTMDFYQRLLQRRKA